MNEHQVIIPVDPADSLRFKLLCQRYKMKVKKNRPYDEYIVWYTNPIDIYFLGANMYSILTETPLTIPVWMVPGKKS